ncbi:Helicase loader DnaI [Anaerostipes rhamnosivorans]|uniref:Helicase loader DnaI n=2 Tax=Anaerostipes rhamnosivorans TaxID=1229621 RepID=A0A4P8IDM4_9FIRM|nr:Helicase loader DnaI [Anaerostipes rhamnosivorans]
MKVFNCPACRDTGWIKSIKNGREYFSECQCRKKEMNQRRLAFANIPAAFYSMRLNTFNTSVYKSEHSRIMIQLACKCIAEYLHDFDQEYRQGRGLYLFSEAKGSGKTRMAASIANELVDRGYQVKFALSAEIIQEIKRTWDRENNLSESSLLDQLQETEILIIDDFGTEQAAAWINEKFYQIINGRYVDRKVTIFTSNYSLMRLRYDDRITSRIEEVSYIIGFPEESVREQIAFEKNKEMLAKVERSSKG